MCRPMCSWKNWNRCIKRAAFADYKSNRPGSNSFPAPTPPHATSIKIASTRFTAIIASSFSHPITAPAFSRATDCVLSTMTCEGFKPNAPRPACRARRRICATCSSSESVSRTPGRFPAAQPQEPWCPCVPPLGQANPKYFPQAPRRNMVMV